MHNMHNCMNASNLSCTSAFVRKHADLHTFGMADEIDIPVLLEKMMEVIPGKQAGLAKRLGRGFDQSAISRYRKGVAPRLKKYNRFIELANELGILSDVRSEDVAASLDKPPKRMVKLKGYVGAGSEGHFYAVAQGDLGEVEAPDTATDKTVALEIIGSSLGKFFDRWLVFYDDVRSPITDDMIGQLCVVGLSDDRVLIKKVLRNGARGKFDLLSNNDTEEPIKAVKIEWAALVTELRAKR